MSNGTTATVETITAEVRVLMVGSRQITASVYGQLDAVTDREIIPFGRVTPKDAQPGYVYVTGKRETTGELVRSFLPATPDAIARWIAARSKAKAYRESARIHEQYAEGHGVAAQNYENRAAELAGDGWASAARYDRDAERLETEAAENDARAVAAESETSRLLALADAATSRHDAAQARDKAAAIREEIRGLHLKAEEKRQAAKASQENADAFWSANEEWTENDKAEQEHIAALAATWSALPLIVLAGLR